MEVKTQGWIGFRPDKSGADKLAVNACDFNQQTDLRIQRIVQSESNLESVADGDIDGRGVLESDTALGEIFDLDDLSFFIFNMLALPGEIDFFAVNGSYFYDKPEDMMTFTSCFGFFSGNPGFKCVECLGIPTGGTDDRRHAFFVGIESVQFFFFQ